MATIFPNYPASTLAQSEELIIFSGNQMHDIINGDALSEVTAEDGNIPTVRKAIADNYYFKSPIAWAASSTETVFNQLRSFTDGSWWWAPQATTTNPISMGASPYNDINWKAWSKDQLATYQNAKRLAAEAGFNMVAGSFYFGGTLNNSSDVLFYEGDGKYYRWAGTFPKVVSAGSTNSDVNWADESSKTLRTQLSRIATYASATGFFRLSDYVSIKDFGAIGDGTLHTLQEWVDSGKFSNLAAIQVAYPCVTSLTQSIDWAAIQTALNTGRSVWSPKGDYWISNEIEQITPGQVIEFEGTGGYGYTDDGDGRRYWRANTRWIAYGAGFTSDARVRTRRNHRASSSDPQDDPLSVVLNIQAEGVRLIRPCLWLNCDYSNSDPSNLGDDCDIGIFVGCRTGVSIIEPQVIGYFRVSGIHFDVTHDNELPRHLDKKGNPYQDTEGTNVSGADGCSLHNPYIIGARRGLVIAGSKPAAGYNWYGPAYYDEQLGTTVTDSRGSFGFSDFCCTIGRVFGPDHHSSYRLADPTLSGGVLNETSLNAESEMMPCSTYIDGMAGNASHGLWGMRFIGTRIATFEAFRMRLGRCARIHLVGCHEEGRNGGRFNTSGVEIDTNDYTLNSYGGISGTSATSRVILDGSVRTSPSDAYPHYYGTAISAHIDYGEAWYESYQPSRKGADFDMRIDDGALYRWRFGTVTGATLSQSGLTFASGTYPTGLNIESQSGELRIVSPSAGIQSSSDDVNIRAASGKAIRLREDDVTMATVLVTGITSYGTSTIIKPWEDNIASVGTASARCSVVYAGTGTINTSDADEKDEFREISEKEKLVAKKLKIQAFKFKDAIRNKGSENARWHFGVVAQEVISAFESEGLNAFDYGLVCYDEWEATEEEKDKEGIVIQEAKPAGKRYGVRYDELSMFILSTLI